jgi:hypothetical protein
MANLKNLTPEELEKEVDKLTFPMFLQIACLQGRKIIILTQLLIIGCLLNFLMLAWIIKLIIFG